MNVRTERAAVVGAGRLGSALARALTRAGMHVAAVSSDGRPSAQRLARELPQAQVVSLADVSAHATLIFLTVPDARIAEVAQQLAVGPEHALIHTSGARGLAVLQSAAERGARVGCFHPLQSFPPDAQPERFVGISIGIEAPAALHAQLAALARTLGAQPISLAGVDRASYHAAAVFASNYVVALHAAAAQAWALSGLPAELARTALAPLTVGAAHSIAAHPLHEALTGPVMRGDVETVHAHLQHLQPAPELARSYRALARALLTLPLSIDEDVRARLHDLLADPS